MGGGGGRSTSKLISRKELGTPLGLARRKGEAGREINFPSPRLPLARGGGGAIGCGKE